MENPPFLGPNFDKYENTCIDRYYMNNIKIKNILTTIIFQNFLNLLMHDGFIPKSTIFHMSGPKDLGASKIAVEISVGNKNNIFGKFR